MGRAGWIGAGIGVLAVVCAVVVGLRAFVAAAPVCHAAGRAAADSAVTGKATFYRLDGGGDCSVTPPADGLFVALPHDEYTASDRCGSYLNVRGPGGTVRVEVIDHCPDCEPGHIDLSRTAFAKIAP